MAGRSQVVRGRGRRAYRSMPVSAQRALEPAVQRARTILGDPNAARATHLLPGTDQIHAREHAALGEFLGALSGGGPTHFLIPTDEPDSVRIGVPADSREALLDALATRGGALWVSWAARRRFMTVPAAAAMGAATDRPTLMWVHHEPKVRNRVDASNVARAVQVEFWSPNGEGGHDAPISNPYASVVNILAPQVALTARTGHEVPSFRAFAVPDLASVTFPVDAVYLWVDDSDPAWRARRGATMRSLGVEPGADSADDARFRQYDELRYSLRSLSVYAPWIRTVHLVTDQQVPDWLDLSCPRIRVVDHMELFGDAGQLPTYNSHALASRLHHLSGLADHFLYLNDDVFFGNRTGPQLWFDGNGQPRFHNTATKVDPPDMPEQLPHTRARNHTLDLVEQLTGRVRRRNIQHGPHPMSKALLQDIEDRLPEDFARTWGSQLRTSDDIVIEWLHNQVGHGWGRTVDSSLVRYWYFNVGAPPTRDRLRAALLSRWAHTFCLNDGEGPMSVPARAAMIRKFLTEYYPTPSEFELPD